MPRRHTRKPTDEHDEASSDADMRLATLAGIIEPLAQSLGPNAEIVLHDYRQPEHSVVAVAGSVTRRKVGSAMSEIGLSVLSEGEGARDRLNYLAATSAGRVIKSSTIVLRDTAGHVFGALCVNLDITELREAAAVLAHLAGEPIGQPQPATFVDNIREVIDTVLAAQLGSRHAGNLTRDDRLAIFRALEERGVFGIRHSLGQVAERLGISRAAGYAYLQTVRNSKETRPVDKQPHESAQA